jgi:hypothetical protein
MNADDMGSLGKTMWKNHAICTMHPFLSAFIGVHRRLKIFLKQPLGILRHARAPAMSDAMMWAKLRVQGAVSRGAAGRAGNRHASRSGPPVQRLLAYTERR